MTEVEKKGIGKTKVGLIISVALVVILAISNVWFYTSLQNQQQQYNMLNTNFQNLQQDYDMLSANYGNLQQDYDSLQDGYDTLYTIHESLVEEYQGALKVPYTTIVGGNVTWVFRTLDESIESWFMPIET